MSEAIASSIGNVAPLRDHQHQLFLRLRTGATAIATVLALGGCDIINGGGGSCQEPPTPYPLVAGERVAWVRVTTIPECLSVRMISEVVAGPPALVERLGGNAVEKEGPAPQQVAVSFEPGFGTRMEVRAFLKNPPPEGAEVTLGCETYLDGEVLVGSDDVEYVDDLNKQTAFVLCVFDENLAPL